MKLRNKKTGEIVRVEFLNNYQTDDGTEIGFRICDTVDVYSYSSLAELNEEWEDVAEPKKHYEILGMGAVMEREDAKDEMFRNQGQREIGNYFETKEEAEKAVEKLKAWKRLKDAGFYFIYDAIEEGSKHKFILRLECNKENIIKPIAECKSLFKDLKTIFGGKE